MEKGLQPRSLPIAILELLVFLWNSNSAVIAKPKRLNRMLEKQRIKGRLPRIDNYTLYFNGFSFLSQRK